MASLIFKDNPHTWHTGNDYTHVTLTHVSWDTAPAIDIAYIFFGHVNIDFDGSSTAYGPPGIQPRPDDDLGNAGNAVKGWFGVASLRDTDPLVINQTAKIDKNAPKYLGKYPVVQQEKNGDPHPDYYVSATPRPSGPEYLQSSYIDSSEVSWGALDGALRHLGVRMGDYGLAIRHNQNLQSGFYFADAGNYSYALGECSIKSAKTWAAAEGRATLITTFR